MLKRLLQIAGLLLVVSACTKGNYLRVTHSAAIKNTLPDVGNGERYVSKNLRDTITLTQISETNSFNRQSFSGTTSPYLGDVDYVEVETSQLVLGVDSPFYYRFTFDIVSHFDPAYPTNGRDELSISMQDENGTQNEILRFTYGDTLLCEQVCLTADTLRFDTLATYTNLYLSDTTALSRQLLLNLSNGIMGFKSASGKQFYQL